MTSTQLTTRFIVALLCCMWAQSAYAQEAPPEASLRIFERDPFDRITLQAASGGGSYQVRPLDFADRRVPTDPDPGSKLKVELIEPATAAEIAWRDIAKVELFEQMVLAEAEALVTKKQFDQAYDYYVFLHAKYPKTPRLSESSHDFLYRNAGALFQQSEFRKAYALLDELHANNPAQPGLAAAMANVTDRIMKDLMRAQQYAAARRLLQYSAQRGGEDDATASLWRTKLQQAAGEQVAAAGEHLAAKRYRQARMAAQQALDIWPTVEGAADLVDEVQQRYPMALIIAPQFDVIGSVPRRLSPTAARQARLTDRPLVVLDGYMPRGPRFESPWGDVILSSDRRQVDIHVQPRQGRSSLTAYDIAGFVAATGKSTGILQSVEVQRVYSARLQLSRGYVSPLSLLAGLSPERTPTDPRWAGDYTREATENETRFVRRANEQQTDDRVLREIIELPTVDAQADLDALRRGRIDVLGRVPPSAVERLRDDDRFELRRYAMPAIHLLIPNARRPYPASRTFRRAVAYAIDRERILQQDIYGRSDASGAQVISGPLPRSENEDDFWGYGYDKAIAPLPYEPRIGLTLWRVAADELARAAAGANRPAPALESIAIGHGDDWLHRRAAMAIVEQLNALGMTSRALLLEDQNDLATCDFVYTEILMQEPVVDAVRLLQHVGPNNSSGYLDLAVRQLGQATNWRQASEQLFKIHAAVHAEQTVIPLWQMHEYFAFRKGVTGVADEPLTLYEDVQDWRLTLE